MNMEFDFLCDTILHVGEVAENLEVCASNLRQRGFAHDRTKFKALEFDAFVSTREKFKKANFGTPEYQACIDIIKPAVDSHYANNSHHTGYYQNGIKDMSLLDILEMVCDWKAANRRSPDLDFDESINRCVKKYNISPELEKIIRTTLQQLSWL